jgi:hypothetical protein
LGLGEREKNEKGSLIIGVNQLMLDTPLDAEQQELTDLIKTSAAGN